MPSRPSLQACAKTSAPSFSARCSLKRRPGAALHRDYQGQRHTVTVAPDGFDWQGTTYASLSAIARAIPGTAPPAKAGRRSRWGMRGSTSARTAGVSGVGPDI
jgi:hypothetical protein